MSSQIENLPPARPNLKEFGAFAGHIGIRLVEWELDRCVIEFDVTDQNLNGTGVLHGGCLATALDTAIAHSAIYCTVPENYR
ncbi:MAG: PaaI family thioesterase, partial [Rhodospirillaceae bacterium]